MASQLPLVRRGPRRPGTCTSSRWGSSSSRSGSGSSTASTPWSSTATSCSPTSTRAPSAGSRSRSSRRRSSPTAPPTRGSRWRSRSACPSTWSRSTPATSRFRAASGVVLLGGHRVAARLDLADVPRRRAVAAPPRPRVRAHDVHLRRDRRRPAPGQLRGGDRDRARRRHRRPRGGDDLRLPRPRRHVDRRVEGARAPRACRAPASSSWARCSSAASSSRPRCSPGRAQIGGMLYLLAELIAVVLFLVRIVPRAVRVNLGGRRRRGAPRARERVDRRSRSPCSCTSSRSSSPTPTTRTRSTRGCSSGSDHAVYIGVITNTMFALIIGLLGARAGNADRSARSCCGA